MTTDSYRAISKGSDLICLYCGKKTTKEEQTEHLFPESTGGNIKLKKGDVCGQCNNKLGKLDALLKTGNYYMMNGYQSSPFLGKKRSGKRREKQREQKEKIIDTRGITEIKFSEDGFREVTSLDFSDHPNFKRALFKVGCNMLCYRFGSKYVRKEYAELIEFVLNNTNHDKFSYMVSYKSMFGARIGFRSAGFTCLCTPDGRILSICLMMTAGIFVLEFKPKTHTLVCENEIIKTICKMLRCDENKLLSEYGDYVTPNNTQQFGRLKFMRKW